MTNNTQDLSKFGFREQDMAGDLLKASANNNWEDGNELGDGIKVEFNPNSGNVFLVDDDYNVAMLNDNGKLENFLTCTYCGNEGLRSEIEIDEDGNCPDCKGK